MATPTLGAMIAAMDSPAEWGAVNTTYLVWDNTNHSLGIGCAPGTTPLAVQITNTHSSGTNVRYGFTAAHYKNATANSTNYSLNQISTLTKVSSGVTDSGYVMGLRISTLRDQSGDAGTLTTHYGLQIQSGSYGANPTGKETTMYGAYIITYTGANTQADTTIYVLYLDCSHAVAPTTYYPIFQNGTTDDVS